MEAETTENVAETPTAVTADDSETTQDGFIAMLSRCGSCKEGLQNRCPKLLSCLHTFCAQCVNSFETGESGQITCPVCRQVSLIANIIDNMFIPDPSVSSGAGALSADGRLAASHMCTGCDENIIANFYCNECTEWLCEPCAQAHRRVKVTKDHTVEPIDQVATISVLGGAAMAGLRRRGLMCPVHAQEQLKLYCDTCSRLTCRDCQLVEHKDHKYQFVQEAATAYKDLLHTLVSKVKEKQAHIHNARNLIDRRHKEISEKEKAVTNEVKTFIVALIREINLKGRQLIGELQAVCNAKRRQLEQKNTEVRLLSDNLEHGLRFAEYLLTHSDDAALLYSRRTLANQLSAILRTRCEVPNPYHVVDLRFAGNQSVTSSLSKLGCIIVDGYQYGHRTMPVGTASNSSSASSAHNALPSAVTAKSLTNEQKMVLMQMRLGQRGHNQQTPSAASASSVKQLPPPDYYTSCSPAPTGHRLSHMPNQSSNISSSNQQHQSMTSGGCMLPGRHSSSVGQPASGFVTNSHSARTFQSGAVNHVTLAQLQEERMRRERREHRSSMDLVSTSLPPIVIQPTDCSSDAHLKSDMIIKFPQTPTDESMANYKTPFSNSSDSARFPAAAKADHTSSSPLCLLTEIKKELKTNDFDLDALATASTSAVSAIRSRTPTPRIESTNQDLINGGSPLSDAVTISSAVDQVINGNQFALSDPIDFATESNTEEMFIVNGGDPQSSKPDEMSDWSVVSATSGDLATGLLNVTGTETETVATGCEASSQSSRNTEDRNDDYCAVCRNGGDLLCCDGCPRVYHLKCHVPMLNSTPDRNVTWLCTLCASSNDKLHLDLPDSRGVSSGKRRLNSCGLTDKELQMCERLLLELYSHELSVPFHEPVSKSVPNYYKIITNPMDFGTIRSRLNKQNFNHYQTIEDFVSDVKLVFANCATFNPPSTEVGRCGVAVDEFFESRLRQLLPSINVRAMTPGSDHSDGSRASRGAKRRKLNVNHQSSKSTSSHGSGDGEGDAVSLDGIDAGDLPSCDNPT